MHPFHDYLATSLARKLKERRVVVWYDPEAEFAPFVEELGAASDLEPIITVTLAGREVQLARCSGSLWALKVEVEPLISATEPKPLLVYIPGIVHEKENSPLAELELGGDCLEPQKKWSLKGRARDAMKQVFTDTQIDEMLAPQSLSYEDVRTLLESPAEGGETTAKSVLDLVFQGKSHSNPQMVAAWLAAPETDKSLAEKDAADDFLKLLEGRGGLAIDEGTDLPKARDQAERYVLANEFRGDLSCEAPSCISRIPEASSSAHMDFVRETCASLRKDYPDAYETMADRVEGALGLAKAEIPVEHLGSIDTFRFEEEVSLDHCAALVEGEKYEEARDLAVVHRGSFWACQNLARRTAQWEVCRLMAELGLAIAGVTKELKALKSPTSDKMLAAYITPEEGWMRADTLHRQLESLAARMEDEPEAERALGAMRGRFESMLGTMATTFTAAFKADGYEIPGADHQRSTYSKHVAPHTTERVAYFFVDAMRYEMGAELVSQLTELEDLQLAPAATSLPSITPIGMSSLLPGAEASYAVVAKGGKAAGEIEGNAMSLLAHRQKFFKDRVPDGTDLALDRVLTSSSSKLGKDLDGVRVLVVRSQELDLLGESGIDNLARQVMDTVIGNVARAVRKLGKLGFTRFVISADHGHQFTRRKKDDMKIDNPGGDCVEVHRRAWIGRGGTTPPGTVRLSSSDLGYTGDLDFIFPEGAAVFKTGGGLSYHHGGLSLQELIVPVITGRFPGGDDEDENPLQVSLISTPESIPTRAFGVGISVGTDLLETEPRRLRVVLVDGGQEVGYAGMLPQVSEGADFDAKTRVVTLAPGCQATVAMMLTKDDCDNLSIVVQDADTDAVLAEKKGIPVSIKM